MRHVIRRRKWYALNRCLAKSRFKNKARKEVSEQEFLEFQLLPWFAGNQRYSSNLDRWQTYFPSEQCCVHFFEEVAERPVELLRQMFRFLGVADRKEYIAEDVQPNPTHALS